MLKRVLLFSVFFVSLSCGITHAAPTVDDFKKAYKEFQQKSSKGKWQAALPHAEKSFKIGKELFGTESKNTAALAHNLGVSLLKLKKRDRAKATLTEAITLHEGVYGKNSAELLPVLNDLADSLYRGGDKKLKQNTLRRVLSITESLYGKDSAHWSLQAVKIGVKLLAKDTLKESHDYIKQGYTGLKKHLNEGSPHVHYAAFQLGKAELTRKNSEESVAFLKEAIAGATAPDSASPSLAQAARRFLVKALENLEQREEATEYLLAIGKAELKEGKRPLKAAVVKVAPKYPKAAIKANQGGFVNVTFDVDQQGFATNLSVTESEGPIPLKKAAMSAIKKYRWVPAFKNGEPVISKGSSVKLSFDIGSKKVTSK